MNMNQLNKMDDIMMDQFIFFCKKTIEENPHLKEEVMGFFDLAMMEIEEGGSQDHEIELAINDIDELINE